VIRLAITGAGYWRRIDAAEADAIAAQAQEDVTGRLAEMPALRRLGELAASAADDHALSRPQTV
jgi:hypothetical protein